MDLSPLIQLIGRVVREHARLHKATRGSDQQGRQAKARLALARFVAAAGWLPADELALPLDRMSPAQRKACAKFLPTAEGSPVAAIFLRKAKPAVVFSADRCRYGAQAHESFQFWELQEMPRLDREDPKRLHVSLAGEARLIEFADSRLAALLHDSLRALWRRRSLDAV